MVLPLDILVQVVQEATQLVALEIEKLIAIVLQLEIILTLQEVIVVQEVAIILVAVI